MFSKLVTVTIVAVISSSCQQTVVKDSIKPVNNYKSWSEPPEDFKLWPEPTGDFKLEKLWRKGDRFKCTGGYSINIDKIGSLNDAEKVVQFFDIKDGWARLYSVAGEGKNALFIELWKCPNSQTQVEEYLKNAKQKYPQAVINND